MGVFRVYARKKSLVKKIKMLSKINDVPDTKCVALILRVLKSKTRTNLFGASNVVYPGGGGVLGGESSTFPLSTCSICLPVFCVILLQQHICMASREQHGIAFGEVPC